MFLSEMEEMAWKLNYGKHCKSQLEASGSGD